MRQVLIIDDENLVIGLLKAVFTKLGYEVRTANDGKEGIEVFNSTHKFDMVITDMTMPGMDGNAVARSIRSSDKGDVPIIAMSGYDDKADNELFNASLQKPFNLQSFTEVIQSIEGGPKVVQNEQADQSAMPEILIIDDQNCILTLLQTFLMELGHGVKTAHDGQEGIEVFDSERNLDLVITDIRMPRMDGNAVARHIRNSDRPDMPIIAISGFVDEVEGGMFNLLIRKPFEIQALADVLEKIKRNHS